MLLLGNLFQIYLQIGPGGANFFNILCETYVLGRLDLGVSDIGVSRALKAINHLKSDPEVTTPNQDETNLTSTFLRDTLLRSFRGDGAPSTIQSKASTDQATIFQTIPALVDWASRYSTRPPKKQAGDPHIKLNESQIQSIALMLGKRISLTQGVRLLKFIL